MPYLPLDDAFAQHPKITPLTDAGFRLHVAGLCYCAKYRTDGRIPADAVASLVPRYKVRTLAELIIGRLWIEVEGGYCVHDYLDWNWSRERIERRQAAGRTAARARWTDKRKATQ